MARKLPVRLINACHVEVLPSKGAFVTSLITRFACNASSRYVTKSNAFVSDALALNAREMFSRQADETFAEQCNRVLHVTGAHVSNNLFRFTGIFDFSSLFCIENAISPRLSIFYYTNYNGISHSSYQPKFTLFAELIIPN